MYPALPPCEGSCPCLSWSLPGEGEVYLHRGVPMLLSESEASLVYGWSGNMVCGFAFVCQNWLKMLQGVPIKTNKGD